MCSVLLNRPLQHRPFIVCDFSSVNTAHTGPSSRALHLLSRRSCFHSACVPTWHTFLSTCVMTVAHRHPSGDAVGTPHRGVGAVRGHPGNGGVKVLGVSLRSCLVTGRDWVFTTRSQMWEGLGPAAKGSLPPRPGCGWPRFAPRRMVLGYTPHEPGRRERGAAGRHTAPMLQGPGRRGA